MTSSLTTSTGLNIHVSKAVLFLINTCIWCIIESTKGMSKIDGTQKGEPKECNIDYRHVHIHADMNFILSLKDLFSEIYMTYICLSVWE